MAVKKSGGKAPPKAAPAPAPVFTPPARKGGFPGAAPPFTKKK